MPWNATMPPCHHSTMPFCALCAACRMPCPGRRGMSGSFSVCSGTTSNGSCPSCERGVVGGGGCNNALKNSWEEGRCCLAMHEEAGVALVWRTSVSVLSVASSNSLKHRWHLPCHFTLCCLLPASIALWDSFISHRRKWMAILLPDLRPQNVQAQ